MSIIKLKPFLQDVSEASISEPKKGQKEVDKVRGRQSHEKDSLKSQQNAELARAREIDFQKAQADREQKAREAEDKKRLSQNEDFDLAFEALEDGTDELVAAYKRDVPGQ